MSHLLCTSGPISTERQSSNNDHWGSQSRAGFAAFFPSARPSVDGSSGVVLSQFVLVVLLCETEALASLQFECGLCWA